MLKYHLTRHSGNAKTGKMPVTTSSHATCPKTCPFYSNCYASSGFRLRMHWNKVTQGLRGNSYTEFLKQVSNLPAGILWRHNQAGDLYKPNTIQGRKMLRQLTAANKGKRGYTYTHHKLTKNTVEAIREANAAGFTVNVSTESEAAADNAIAQGLPAVMVVKSTETRTNWQTANGNKVVVCPAQRRDDITCSKCQLCQNRKCNLVVAFKAHSVNKKAIDSILEAA